jgi:hypothetical protein
MMRSGLGLALLLAALGSACSGSEGSSPTAPTTTAGGGSTGTGTSPTNQSCVPSAPGNLRVTANEGTRVFNWNAVSGVQDYFVQIGSSSGASNLINTNTTQTTYTWTGVGVGTFYARVYARNSCGSGPNSSEVTFN